MNKTLLKKTAAAAFAVEFGVEPKLKDIILLEASEDRTYIMFELGKHQWQFNSRIMYDGSVWVGYGTLKIYE